jgi:hypothetical protein
VHESARLATSRSKGGMADHVGALPNKSHPSVHGDGVDARHGLRQEVQRGADSGRRKHQAQQATGKTEQQTFEDRFADDDAGTRTESRITLPSRRRSRLGRKLEPAELTVLPGVGVEMAETKGLLPRSVSLVESLGSHHRERRARSGSCRVVTFALLVALATGALCKPCASLRGPADQSDRKPQRGCPDRHRRLQPWVVALGLGGLGDRDCPRAAHHIGPFLRSFHVPFDWQI